VVLLWSISIDNCKMWGGNMIETSIIQISLSTITWFYIRGRVHQLIPIKQSFCSRKFDGGGWGVDCRLVELPPFDFYSTIDQMYPRGPVCGATVA
jgi:hypothetical protein